MPEKTITRDAPAERTWADALEAAADALLDLDQFTHRAVVAYLRSLALDWRSAQ